MGKCSELNMFVNTIFNAWFRSKINFNKLLTSLWEVFPINIPFVSQYRDILRNLNLYQKFIEQNRMFQMVLVVIFYHFPSISTDWVSHKSKQHLIWSLENFLYDLSNTSPKELRLTIFENGSLKLKIWERQSLVLLTQIKF